MNCPEYPKKKRTGRYDPFEVVEPILFVNRQFKEQAKLSDVIYYYRIIEHQNRLNLNRVTDINKATALIGISVNWN